VAAHHHPLRERHYYLRTTPVLRLASASASASVFISFNHVLRLHTRHKLLRVSSIRSHHPLFTAPASPSQVCKNEVPTAFREHPVVMRRRSFRVISRVHGKALKVDRLLYWASSGKSVMCLIPKALHEYWEDSAFEYITSSSPRVGIVFGHWASEAYQTYLRLSRIPHDTIWLTGRRRHHESCHALG